MATPTGDRADAARNWFARERRRNKQDQKDFDIAGFVAPGGTPFDFGAVAAGGSSANLLTLPASLEIALEINAATTAGDLGVLDTTDSIDLSPKENARFITMSPRYFFCFTCMFCRTTAAPWPPPIQAEAQPYRMPRPFMSYIIYTIIRTPVAAL